MSRESVEADGWDAVAPGLPDGAGNGGEKLDTSVTRTPNRWGELAAHFHHGLGVIGRNLQQAEFCYIEVLKLRPNDFAANCAMGQMRQHDLPTSGADPLIVFLVRREQGRFYDTAASSKLDFSTSFYKLAEDSLSEDSADSALGQYRGRLLGDLCAYLFTRKAKLTLTDVMNAILGEHSVKAHGVVIKTLIRAMFKHCSPEVFGKIKCMMSERLDPVRGLKLHRPFLIDVKWLYFMIEVKHAQMVRDFLVPGPGAVRLFDADAIAGVDNPDKKSALQAAIENNLSTDAVKMLVAQSMKLNHADLHGRTAVMSACLAGDDATLSVLLKYPSVRTHVMTHVDRQGEGAMRYAEKGGSAACKEKIRKVFQNRYYDDPTQGRDAAVISRLKARILTVLERQLHTHLRTWHHPKARHIIDRAMSTIDQADTLSDINNALQKLHGVEIEQPEVLGSQRTLPLLSSLSVSQLRSSLARPVSATQQPAVGSAQAGGLFQCKRAVTQVIDVSSSSVKRERKVRFNEEVTLLGEGQTAPLSR